MSNKKNKNLLINLGFNNVVVREKIVAVVAPEAAPIKRLREEARQSKKLIDATSGRRTRAVIITDSDHIILASVQPETIAQRFRE
jgi:extracellular matrix regulatory protein A